MAGEVEAARILVSIGADASAFNAAMAGASAKIGAVGARMSSAGGAISKASLPLLGIGVAAVKMSLDFDQSMTNIQALVGAGAKDMKMYRESVLNLAKGTTQGPKELADALYFVTSSGFKGEAAMRVLKASSMAAAAGLGSTAVVADGVTSAVNAYGEKALSASKATDILVAAIREGKAEPEEFAGTIGRITGVAESLGIEFGEVAGGMAALSTTGLDAAEGVTALRGIMGTMLKPSKDANDLLKANGMSMEGLRDQVKNKGLLPSLQMLRDKFGDNKEALADLFPNVRALSGFLQLTGKNAKKNAEIVKATLGAQGDTARAFAEAMKSNSNKIKTAWSSIQVALIQLGGVLAPVVASIAAGLVKVVSAFQALPKGVQTATLAVLGVIAVGGPLLMLIGSLVTAFSILLTPIGAVILIIAGLAAGFAYLYKTSATFRDIIGYIGAALKGQMSPVDALAGVLLKLGLGFKTTSQIISDARKVVAALGVAWQALKPVVAAALNLIMTLVTSSMKIIAAALKVVWALLHGEWGKAWQAAKDLVRVYLSQLVQIAGALLRLLGVTVGRAAVAAGKAIWEGIKLYVTKVLPWMAKEYAKIPPALVAAGIAAAGAAAGVGLQIAQSIVSGMAGLPGMIAKKVGGWIGAGLRAINVPGGSPVTTAGAHIVGIPLGESVVRGILLGLTAMPTKMSEKIGAALTAARDRVSAQQSIVTDAFSKLGSKALEAYDAQTSAMMDKINAKLAGKMASIDKWRSKLTASEQQLANMDNADKQNGLAKGLSDAQAGLDKANSEGDPATILAAQEALAAAQRAILRSDLEAKAAIERTARDAEAAKREAAEQKKAAKHTLNLQSERALVRDHMEARITAIAKGLADEKITYETAHTKLMKMFAKDFGPAYKTSGANLGNSFADGIRESFAAVRAAVRELAEIVSANVKTHSPTKEGPMSDLDKWWGGFAPALLSGLDTSAVRQGAAEAVNVSPAASGLAPTAGGRGGDIIINVQVDGSVTAERDLAETIRASLLRSGRRNLAVGLS